MKFKEQRCNVFVFDVDGVELECTLENYGHENCIHYVGIRVWNDLQVETEAAQYKDIQTAVQMMQILIDRGLV